MQAAAAGALGKLAAGSQQGRKVVVAAGAVPMLVALLGPAVQEKAAAAVCAIAAGSQQNRDAIIAAGAVPPLVGPLRADQPAVQEKAARALSNLSAKHG